MKISRCFPSGGGSLGDQRKRLFLSKHLLNSSTPQAEFAIQADFFMFEIPRYQAISPQKVDFALINWY
ncbi:hypothetical protein HOV93_18780 [Planctomycetes bacterium FF15]|uniref:Uncharacterized protein n=1 Tax=Bremerella alba TaxID=980252 RepID=A0A7V9A6V9_9BACT|nr:hypothetical protein [Bremerella alba]